MAAQKSVAVAYFLWFILGWFGVHLFYLRRDRHAFFTWATVGGVFGISWLRDLFYIPSYVADVNETPEYMEQLTEKMRLKPSPTLGLCRWAACVALGYIFGAIAYAVFWSDDLNDRYITCLAILAHFLTATGVYIPSNEGRLKVGYLWCLLGSFGTLPLTVMYGWDMLWYAALLSSASATYNVEWRRQPHSASLCSRVAGLTLLGIVYLGLISVGVYYNATITTKGETVPLREAVQHFFKSPAWRETKETMTQIYNYYKHHGWSSIWEELKNAFDPTGENHAYEVLGLTSSATQKEIKSAYKTLALKYHPDKEKDPEKKQEVADKFMEIQKAYNTLSSLKTGRTKKNEL